MLGQTIAHYEILSLLGKGGMGEVYRARDTKLGREVAIKVLPTELLRDQERVARFQREARTLASLNHTNIAGLFGVEEAGGRRFLVMELAEGEDLSDRIAQGPLPLDEALAIAEQIADALEDAHEAGIVHRDLKPANIKVSSDGKVKLLDFGLARAFQGEKVDESDLGNSPTITAAMTQAGMILGTAAYMSPEQAKGKTVDRRADVWSYGVILWEMLTGKRLFEAETTSEVLAAVLRADPPWEELPETVPAGVRRLLERCLERDPRQRLRDIGEARIRLKRWATDPTTMHESSTGTIAAAVEPRAKRAWVPWALAGVAIAVAVWGFFGRSEPVPEESTSLALSIELPGQELLPGVGSGGAAIKLSPTGERLAYVTGQGLFLRRLDGLEVSRVDGSESARDFDFSPDGRWIAYAARGSLFRASVTGGAPIRISAAEDPRGVAWVDDTTLIFPPTYFHPLVRVSTETGEVQELTTLDPSRGERSHRWPSALPGGRAILMTCQFTGKDYDESDIQVVYLDTKERKTVYRGGSFPQYVETGHLLFVRDHTLFAIAFDPEKMETSGQPVPVLEDLATSVNDQELDNGSAEFDISPHGLLVYRTRGSGTGATRAAYIDFESGQTSPLGAEGMHTGMTVSPDGRWVAVSRSIGAGSEIHLVDTRSRVERRFTGRDTSDRLGAFSPDSRTLYWSTTVGDGTWWLVRQALDGSSPIDTVTSLQNSLIPQSFSADGRHMYVTFWTGADAWDVGSVDLEASDPQVVSFIGGTGNQLQCRASPDGRWIAYWGQDMGQNQLYIRREPDTGAVWQLTRENLRWRGLNWTSDSGALLIASERGVHRIRIQESDGLVDIRPTETLFAGDLFTTGTINSGFWPLPDAKGAYVLDQANTEAPREMEVILVTDWFQSMRTKFAEER